MKPITLALFALMVVGCSSARPSSPAEAGTDSGNMAGATKPEVSLNGGEPGSGVATSTAASREAKVNDDAAKAASKPSSSDPKDNPNRINQLRELRVINLKAGSNLVHAWVMDNESKRQEGMMFLVDKDVKENQGMIFVFPDLQKVAENKSFWMHNCPMGLDIIYIGKNKHVLNVGDGKPQNDTPVVAAGDYFYVLEMKRGWSKRHGLKKGDLIAIPKSLMTLE